MRVCRFPHNFLKNKISEVNLRHSRVGASDEAYEAGTVVLIGWHVFMVVGCLHRNKCPVDFVEFSLLFGVEIARLCNNLK